MNKVRKNIFYGALLFCSFPSLTSCIDEDLSDCPSPNKEVELTYELEVAQDVALGFSNEVNSLHLGFWTSPTSLYRERIISKEDIPENLLFKVTLPVDNYSHIAIANGEQRNGVYNPYPTSLLDAVVKQNFIAADTISATSAPVYVGTLQMQMKDNSENEYYEVLLKPVSSKYILHVNHPKTLKNMKCFISGTQQELSCWEQIWKDNDRLITNASDFATAQEENTDFSFYAFPTAERESSKAIENGNGTWKIYFYSQLDDKTIQHIFTLKKSVFSGQVLEATFNVTEQGGEAIDVEAGVQFDPDWNPGNEFETDM